MKTRWRLLACSVLAPQEMPPIILTSRIGRKKKIITTPRPEIYEALIEAHIALKNQASAKHFYEEMMYLFPTTKTQFKRQRIEPADE